ncbi:transposase [Streptococcus sp. H31]|uniref:transposase n=1 Tax=Streptococcus huangxiaojuni TaxID=3237239 RepID=UPI0034A3E1FF
MIQKTYSHTNQRLCSYRGIEIIEGHLMQSVGKYLAKNKSHKFHRISKGRSVLMMFDKHANLKYKFGNQHFWTEDYYVSIVEPNEATIKKYIKE